MTFKEKFEKECPKQASANSFPWWGCPNGHFPDPESADGKCPDGCDTAHTEINCTRCWNRTIPGTEETQNNNKGEKTMATTRKTKEELLKEIADLKKQVEDLERYKQYENYASEHKSIYDSFVNAGFTEEQAFELLKISITAAANLNKR